MQTVSENWAGILAGQHVVNFKMVIAGETYAYADIVSGSIHLSLMETLSLGNTDCGTIEVTFKPRGAIPTMGKIECFVQISNGKDTIFITGEDGAVIIDHEEVPLVSQTEEAGDWLPFGVFYIDTRKTDSFGWMTITGYDAMLMCEQLYLDNEGQYPMAMREAVDFIAGLIGVEVDARSTIADYAIDYPAEIYTLREVLGGIGAASGGNWCMSPAGKLWLVPLASPQAMDETLCGSYGILEGGMVTISRVSLYPDDGTKRTAGDDSGYEITGSCAYATDEMCAALLAKLRGVTYLPMEAEQALIDPALELGDSICIDGNRTILGDVSYTLGMGMTARVAAPIDSEINHEYPYGQSGSRTERQLAQAYSAINKTTEEIRMEVAAADGRYTEMALDMDGLSAEVQGLEGEYTALALTVGGFTITDPSGTTKIRGSSIDTSTLNVENINIDLTGAIQWKDLSEAVQDEIDTALGYADEALDAVSAITYTYGGKTYIDESCIMTGSVIAGSLIGGTVGLLTSAQREAGGLDITGSSSSTYAIELWSNGALRLTAESGAVYLEDASGAHLSLEDDTAVIQGSSAYFEASDQAWVQGHLLPVYKEAYYVGNTNFPWLRMYTVAMYVDGEAVTSDRNKKHDIVYDLSRFDAVFDGLQPVTYKLNNGTSNRDHIGLVAQDVEELITRCGLTGQDIGVVVREIAEDGTEHYYLRYQEFIGLLIDQVQKLKARVARMEAAYEKN